MKYKTISESYNDDNEAKYSSDPKEIFKFAKKKKKIIKNFIRRQFPTLLLLNFLKVH